MDINKTLEELDKYYAEKHMAEAEVFLLDKLREAESEKNDSYMVTIMNELIGFYRDLSRYKDALLFSERVIELMEKAGFANTIPFATTLLNVANAYRAAGKLEESLKNYKEVQRIYKGNLPENDFRTAALYNNMSLLYQETGEYEKAYQCLENALKIIAQYPNADMEMAVTYTNLGITLLKLDNIETAITYVGNALAIFERDLGNKDFHYSAALSAMGEAHFKIKNYNEAVEYYRASLKEIKANMGENMLYALTCSNLAIVYNEMGALEEAEKSREKARKIKKIYENVNQ